MNKKLLSASNLLKAINSLHLSCKLMNQAYISQWDLFNTYLSNEKELFNHYDSLFEKNLRAILFDLNHLLNIYHLGWRKNMIDPLIEEITSLNEYVTELKERIPILESSVEHLAGRLAVEEYKCNELDKMQKRNETIQEELENEIETLKINQQMLSIDKIEVPPKEAKTND